MVVGKGRCDGTQHVNGIDSPIIQGEGKAATWHASTSSDRCRRFIRGKGKSGWLVRVDFVVSAVEDRSSRNARVRDTFS
jgi:hypothetical protein